ncbi:MAG: methyltransferase domain-containing protein [Fusicatenibacter sp.]|nr:methyltransferase domain-containing protein [Fusicatenibacter sp.]
MKNYQITEWCHRFISEQVQPGDLCIDATMGNGNDTELLCRLAGPSGHVLAFDIQMEALRSTRERLEAAQLPANYELICDSHENLLNYAARESVSCITFNFGYLPGGDHTKSTKASSSLTAVAAGLQLLKKGGLMSLCIYSGGDTGFEEKEALLSYLEKLDPHAFLVIRSDYLNRPNHPPVPVLVIRD